MYMTDLLIEVQQSAASAVDNLRNVDLNLLTVFDAVMQMQNITRAAQMLGMSQPAVSNAVSRLKVMFNDDLFVRSGRGIQPTLRAQQLFGPIRQALQMVLNELPGAGFDVSSSLRQFNIAVCSPLDIRLTANIFHALESTASPASIKFQTVVPEDIEHQLHYQSIEFVIGYRRFDAPGFCNQTLFTDELVLVSAQNHPRISPDMSDAKYLDEQHAIIMLDRFHSFSLPYYESSSLTPCIGFEGTDLNSVMNVVSKTNMVALVPRWLAQNNAGILNLNIISLPWMKNQLPCYLSWHESSSKDKGNMWMKGLLEKSDLGQ